MAIKACIFDFDGTLVDSLMDVFESMTHAFVSCGITGISLDPETIMQVQLPDAIKSAAPGITGEQCTRVTEAFMEHYDSSEYRNTKLLPGVQELLTGLREKTVPCIIVSNKRRVPMLRIMDKFKIKDYFSDVFNPDMHTDPAIKKTKSELIAAAIAKHNLPKNATAYLGDMEVDIIAAKENGLIAVAVVNGYGSADKYRTRPDYAMHRISELLALV